MAGTTTPYDDVEIGRGQFAKLDHEQRIVFGFAYIAKRDGEQVTDHSGEFVDDAALPDLEKAAYSFMLDSRQGDEMHVVTEGVGQVVESVFLTPEKLEKMGLSGDVTGWWIGMKVTDPDVWSKIRDGQYKQFSIAGAGVREAV